MFDYMNEAKQKEVLLQALITLKDKKSTLLDLNAKAIIRALQSIRSKAYTK